MKQYFSLFKKLVALFLATFFFAMAGISFFGILYCIEFEYYTSTKSQLRHEMLLETLGEETEQAFQKYWQDADPIGYYENTNFRFQITSSEGDLLYNLQDDDALIESVTVEFVRWISDEPDTKLVTYTVTGSMAESGTDLFRVSLGFVDFMYALRFVLIGLLAAFGVGTAACLVYLLYAAGRHPDHEKAICGPIEKIPFDLYLALYALFGFFTILLFSSINHSSLLFIAFAAFCIMFDFLMLVSFGMSISVRIQTGTLWKNTLIFIVFSFFSRNIRGFFHALPFIWRTVVFLLCYGLIDVFLYLFTGNFMGYFIIMIFKYLIVLPLIFYLVYQFRKLQKGAEHIKDGGFTEQIDTEKLHGEFRAFGDTLNTISDGLGKAVDARMRSERMKTELITNVSHDIKTPLTSIINYADLLKKEKIENERAGEYIEVIDRQASRLKKLITDLVEASKASTGNIQVNPERCDISVLLEQVAGEYDEKFKQAELFPVLRIPEEPICIYADGRLLWRVFDNLLGNICKYSLPGTRVYLNAAVYGAVCIISFKNISRTELNISPDELVERFVRADSSRSTEGNGLGLSIAQSLVDLQGGTLEIVADGDLFKVNLQFPIMKEDQAKNPT